jgi:uncharacterized membrane protein
MTNLIVITFSNESKAIDGSHKLSELESFGDISIFERVMVKKDANGNVTVLETDTTEGLRTVSGMAIGTMLGALGGPVGMLAGMLAGTMTGAVLESDHFDFSEDFGTKISKRLQPGTVALIAEISEEGPSIVDTALEPLATAISRSDVDYEYDEYVDDQIEEIDDDISAERAKIKSAVATDKSKIQKKVDQLKEKRKKRIQELKAKVKSGTENRRTARMENKKTRIEDRIHRHQERISELEAKLKEIGKQAGVTSH